MSQAALGKLLLVSGLVLYAANLVFSYQFEPVQEIASDLPISKVNHWYGFLVCHLVASILIPLVIFFRMIVKQELPFDIRLIYFSFGVLTSTILIWHVYAAVYERSGFLQSYTGFFSQSSHTPQTLYFIFMTTPCFVVALLLSRLFWPYRINYTSYDDRDESESSIT